MTSNYIAQTENTTIASWLLIILKTLKQLNISPELLTNKLNIDLAYIKKNPNQRILLNTMTKVWKLARQLSNRPDIGFLVASNFQPQHFKGLGFSLLASETIKQCFQRISKYSDSISNSVNVCLESKNNLTAICINVKPNTEVTDEAMDAFMLIIHNFVKTLLDDDNLKANIEFASSNRELSPVFKQYFGTPVICNQKTYRYWLDNELLNIPLSMGDKQLASQNEQQVEKYIAEFLHHNTKGWLDVVKNHIQNLLQVQNLNSSQLASNLNMSERSLRRKLQRHGVNYQLLVDENKKELSIKWLTNGRHSITEISYLLGYKDTSNYNRAFKRWFNTTPKNVKKLGTGKDTKKAAI